MANSLTSTRLALRAGTTIQRPHGAWWPQNRTLGSELSSLFELWPSNQGHVARILFSPPDWDDHPHSVQVKGRPVKTGSFPRDDTGELTLVMQDGTRRFITVIPPKTRRGKATRLLSAMTKSGSDYRSTGGGSDYRSRWENEGGHA